MFDFRISDCGFTVVLNAGLMGPLREFSTLRNLVKRCNNSINLKAAKSKKLKMVEALPSISNRYPKHSNYSGRSKSVRRHLGIP